MTHPRTPKLLALRCEKCGLRLWLRASDSRLAPGWSGRTVAHLGGPGTAGEPLTCPAHEGNYYLVAAGDSEVSP